MATVAYLVMPEGRETRSEATMFLAYPVSLADW